MYILIYIVGNTYFLQRSLTLKDLNVTLIVIQSIDIKRPFTFFVKGLLFNLFLFWFWIDLIFFIA